MVKMSFNFSSLSLLGFWFWLSIKEKVAMYILFLPRVGIFCILRVYFGVPPFRRF